MTIGIFFAVFWYTAAAAYLLWQFFTGALAPEPPAAEPPAPEPSDAAVIVWADTADVPARVSGLPALVPTSIRVR